ncbi:MAG TPA: hypothetical protein DC054_09160 [Blastocatellia bacterium]|nr:hypothetical protein [Blastocatellia bacterium]
MARKRLQKISDILKEVGLKEADDRLREKDREIQHLKTFERQAHDSRPEALRRFFETSRGIWCEDHAARPPASIYIDDPIYRQLFIEKDIAPICAIAEFAI